MHRYLKAIICFFSFFAFLALSLAYYYDVSLPDEYYIREGDVFAINSKKGIVVSQKNKADVSSTNTAGKGTMQMSLKLLGVVSIKDVKVEYIGDKTVVACGNPFGIKMFTHGVMVVGMTDVDTEEGPRNPARDAGIIIGDVILEIDGIQVQTNEDVAEIISSSDGNPLKVRLIRGNTTIITTITAIKNSSTKNYRAGMWVRDSSAGIGTLTFYDPKTHVFGGLGHAVCDIDTGEILPILSGEVVDVSITGAVKGASGVPGELQGIFNDDKKIGDIYLNVETGVFGKLNYPPYSTKTFPIGYQQEIQEDKAVIMTTLTGEEPRAYDIIIEKVNFGDKTPTKNLVIRVVDEELIAATGGIVQGMSGSPIIQNGKIIGAVTHVFINDPTRGYGIFIENMYKPELFVDF